MYSSVFIESLRFILVDITLIKKFLFRLYQILGSEKEVEEFEHLSPEVAKERLRKLAVKMDRNLDGKIDKKELQVNNTTVSSMM